MAHFKNINDSLDASKTNVNVKINAGATYGVIVLPPSIKLYGDFVKQ